MIQKAGLTIILSLLCLLILFGLGPYFFPLWGSILHPLPPTKTQPTLKIFPLNSSVEFIQASSTLTLEKMKRDKYELKLHSRSETSTPTYLRQDVSLIYSNGLLVERLYGWKENSPLFEQTTALKGEGSARYNVITFHHAEIHDPDDNITSQQALSQDHVYILSSAFSPTSLFRKATTNTQKQWQRILDSAIQEQWEYHWNYLIRFFKLDSNDYELIPLTQLSQYQKAPFPYFSEEETKQIIGAIWEGLYRQYVLGMIQPPHEEIKPEGSTVPIILLAKDKTHLHILFRTAKGHEIQLIQQINP